MNDKEKQRLARLLTEAYSMPISVEKQAEFLLNNGVIMHAFDEGDKVYALYAKVQSWKPVGTKYRRTNPPGRLIKSDHDVYRALRYGEIEVRETGYSKSYKKIVGMYVFETSAEAEKRKAEILEQWEKEQE